MYYEAHITMDVIPDLAALQIMLSSYAWHYSCIDGDEVMGKHKLHYATRSFDGGWALEDVKAAVNAMAGMLLEHRCRVIRRKVEMVVWDERTVTH